MKRKVLGYTESMMYFFRASVMYNEYKASFNSIMSYMMEDKSRMIDLSFTNSKRLFLDNNIDKPCFMELNDLIVNSWMFKDEKLLKSIQWNRKLFYYCDKQWDKTVYHVIGNMGAIEQFLKIYNFISWSYKKNLTKKERSFVFRHKHGFFSESYSYNFLYWEELQEDIKRLKSDMTYLEDKLNLMGLSSDEWEELEDIRYNLELKLKFEDKLLYSINEDE